ncbi:phage tail tube protein [Sphingomonas sp.]|jgi:predicted secreted protein|uniref:phage tail tube protein n=1 Tax=Sphingomonas sp. TaxID=28214 RepID=UPI003BA99EBE
MATKHGKDSRLHIGDGTTPTEAFDIIGGETSWEYSSAAQELDESSKDDGDIAAFSFGQRKITIKVSGITKLPDDGLARAITVSKSATKKVNVKLLEGAVVLYAGEVAIGNVNVTGPKDGPRTWSFDMVASAVPTTDNMAAVA